jgi:hypothetical protein
MHCHKEDKKKMVYLSVNAINERWKSVNAERGEIYICQA